MTALAEERLESAERDLPAKPLWGQILSQEPGAVLVAANQQVGFQVTDLPVLVLTLGISCMSLAKSPQSLFSAALSVIPWLPCEHPATRSPPGEGLASTGSSLRSCSTENEARAGSYLETKAVLF